jgi:tetratricopeptide (TPR) repeat protein
MTSMVDKSLVQRVEPENAEPRFVMLETLREYALERLTEGGDEALARRAHAAYFLVLAEEESGGSAEAERAGWLDRCELEHANYRAALDWMIETDAAEWGLRLGSALFRFWDERDLLAEGRDRLARVLRLPKAAAYPKPRARALFAAGVLAGEQRDHESSESLWRESLAINRELGDEWGVGVVVNAMAVGALDRGDAPIARELLEENLVRWRQLGDRVAVARCVSNLANVAKTQGDHARARVLYDESLEIFRSIGDRTGVAWALNSQGDLAREAGDSATARAYYEQSLASFREAGERWGTAGALSDLGNLAREEGSHATADSLYRESLEIFLELAHQRGVARLLECFSVSAAAQSQPQRALRLAGAAAALRQSLGAPLARNEQERLETALVTARRALPDREGTAAWLEGWGLPIERSVEIASSGAA